MSRPWKVAETGSSRNGERAISTASTTPPRRLGRQPQQPVVGTDEHAVVREPQRHRPPLGADVGIDDRQVDADRHVGQRAGERSARRRGRRAAATPWVMSITRASGQIVAITPWHTPTKSSARP